MGKSALKTFLLAEAFVYNARDSSKEKVKQSELTIEVCNFI